MKVTDINPDYVDAYMNIGNVLQEQQRLDEALEVYKTAVKINPNYEVARVAMISQAAAMCDWDIISENKEFITRLGMDKEAVQPFAFFSLDDHPYRHKIRNEKFSSVHFCHRALPFSTKSRPNAPIIRIGYFSSDFYEHPVSYLILGILKSHSKVLFETYAYSFETYDNSQMQTSIRSAVDHQKRKGVE